MYLFRHLFSHVFYIREIYENSVTSFALRAGDSAKFHPTCGVRQGDPLSPLLFNLVLDCLIRQINNTPIGINIDGLKLSISAYADDLILFASTKQGLQMNVDRASSILKFCNLQINATKSFSLTIKIDDKNKLSKVVESEIKIDRNPLRAIKINDEFKYLGVKFGAAGLVKANPESLIQDLLSKAKHFPLKPNQKLFVLNNY